MYNSKGGHSNKTARMRQARIPVQTKPLQKITHSQQQRLVDKKSMDDLQNAAVG
jgi:hypothetical protein